MKVKRFIHVSLLSLVACVTVLMVPGGAVSDPGLALCREYLAPEPEVYGQGIGSLLRPQDSHADDPGSAGGGHYETYGMAGTQWHTIVTKDCFDANRVSTRGEIANILWDMNRIGASLVIFMYQLAASGTLLEWLEKLVVSMVIGLRDGFWRPLISIAVFIGALWLGWVGLIKKRATLTFQGVAWMIFSLALAFWLMAAPAQALSLANKFNNLFTVSIHNALADTPLASSASCPPDGVKIDFQGGDNPTHFSGGGTGRAEQEGDIQETETVRPRDPAENDGGGPVEPGGEMDEDSNVIDGETPSGPDGESEGPSLEDLRMAPMSASEPLEPGDFTSTGAIGRNSDLMFCAFVYFPWASGVFGDGSEASEAADSFSRQALQSQALSTSEVEAWGRGADFNESVYDATLERKTNEYRAVSEQVFNYYPDSWPYWSGSSPTDRIVAASLALIGLLLGGSLVFAISFALVVLDAVFLFFLLAMPIVFLVGIHPGFGRRVLGGYFELLAGVAFMMVALVLMKTAFLIFYGHIFALPVPWQVKVVLMGVLLGVVIWGRKRVAKKIAALSSGAMSRIADRVANDQSLRIASMANPAVASWKANKRVAGAIRENLPLVSSVLTGGAAALGAAGRKRPRRSPQQAPPRTGNRATTTAREVPDPPPLRPQLTSSAGKQKLSGGSSAAVRGTPPTTPPPATPPTPPRTPSGGSGGSPTAPSGGAGQTVTSPLSGRRVVILKRGSSAPVSVPREEIITEERRPAPSQAPPLRRHRIVYDRPLTRGSQSPAPRQDPPRRTGEPPRRT